MTSKHDEPIKNLTQEISMLREENKHGELKESLLRLGTLFLNKGDAPKALTVVEEALQLAEEQGDQITQARLYGLKGLSLRQIGNGNQALQAFNKSRKLSEKIEHNPILIDAYSQIGRIEVESGKVEKGIKDLEKGYRLAFEIGDQQREMYIAGIMGNTFMVLEQEGKAMEFFSIALDASQELEKKESESQFHIAIGHIYLLKKDFGPAEEHFQNALDIGSRLKNPKIEFSAFESLFHLSLELDNLDMVVFNGDQAIRLAQVIEDIGAEAQTLKRLVQFLFVREEYRNTMPYYQRALELAEIAHDKAWQMDMIAQKGLAHYFLEELEEAKKLLMEAYEMATQMQKSVDLAQIAGKLGATKVELGEIEDGMKYTEEAIRVANAQGLTGLEGEQLVIQAMNYHDLGDIDQAKNHVQRAIELFKNLDRLDLLEQAEALLESFS